MVSNGGKTYTVTIRTGAMWNTSPPRQVTGADVMLGIKRACNPTQPFGGLPDYEARHRRVTAQFCTGFAKVSPNLAAAINDYIERHQISGREGQPEQTVTYQPDPAGDATSRLLTLRLVRIRRPSRA